MSFPYFNPHPHARATDTLFSILHFSCENTEKQKDKLVFSDFFDPESNCLDRIYVILIGIKTTRKCKGADKK